MDRDRDRYQGNSPDVVTGFDSASVPPLDQGHGDADEEEHFSLLHAVQRQTATVTQVKRRALMSLGLRSYLLKWKRWCVRKLSVNSRPENRKR